MAQDKGGRPPGMELLEEALSLVMNRKKVLVMMKLEQEIQKMKEEQQKTNLLLLYL